MRRQTGLMMVLGLASAMSSLIACGTETESPSGQDTQAALRECYARRQCDSVQNDATCAALQSALQVDSSASAAEPEPAQVQCIVAETSCTCTPADQDAKDKPVRSVGCTYTGGIRVCVNEP